MEPILSKGPYMRPVSVLTAAAALVIVPGAANAHPKLVSAFSKAGLIMATVPGVPEMKIASTAALAADGRTLVVTPKAPLYSGRYSVAWHIVSTDTHKAAGSFAFSVK